MTVPRNCSGSSWSHWRNAASGGRLDGLADLIVLAALLADLDDVALADLVGGDVDLLAVHLDVAVADELAGLGAGGGEAEGVDHVVEPELELAEQVLTGDAGARCRALEVDAGTGSRADRKCA